MLLGVSIPTGFICGQLGGLVSPLSLSAPPSCLCYEAEGGKGMPFSVTVTAPQLHRSAFGVHHDLLSPGRVTVGAVASSSLCLAHTENRKITFFSCFTDSTESSKYCTILTLRHNVTLFNIAEHDDIIPSPLSSQIWACTGPYKLRGPCTNSSEATLERTLNLAV